MNKNKNKLEEYYRSLTYRHYGTNKLILEKDFLIRNANGSLLNKPSGCIWGSTIGKWDSWDSWCKDEKFNLAKLKKHVDFKIKDNAKLLIINSRSDVEKLPCDIKDSRGLFGDISINWEIIATKYDIVIVDYHMITRDYEIPENPFYGWDCFSVVVMNPVAIEVVTNKRVK